MTPAALRPVVTLAGPAAAVHAEAARRCFVANSVAFPVRHEPSVGAVDDEEG